MGLYGKVEEALRLDGLASVRVKESHSAKFLLRACLVVHKAAVRKNHHACCQTQVKFPFWQGCRSG